MIKLVSLKFSGNSTYITNRTLNRHR